jgi:hypothetical protein
MLRSLWALPWEGTKEALIGLQVSSPESEFLERAQPFPRPLASCYHVITDKHATIMK